LGFRQGTIPMTTQPFAARTPDEADQLVWNSFCVMNLANYLPQLLRSVEPPRGPKDPPPEGPLPKVAVLATGCWSRNIVVQTQERQVARDRLVVVGIGSRGMVDRRKVSACVNGREILKVEEEDHKLIVDGRDFREEINRWDVVRDNCRTCVHPDPVIFDIRIGKEASERRVDDRFSQVNEIEAMSPDERWEWFQKEISGCIRCYACRNACPLCYCTTCFVDDSRPQWVGKSVDKNDTAMFHILRAFHCAGRCTDCGACESVCPMAIRMRLLTKKLEKDVLELYSFEPGLDPESPLPLTTYRPDDPQAFMITEQPGSEAEQEEETQKSADKGGRS